MRKDQVQESHPTSEYQIITTSTEKTIYVKGKNGIKYVKVPATTTSAVEKQMIKNLSQSVTLGHKQRITIKGVGYKAQVNENQLELSLGYKLPVIRKIPSNIKIKIKGSGQVIEGWSTSYQALHQFLSMVVELRAASKDKYNGKGIIKWTK